MDATQPQLEAVLTAARRLLEARQAHMQTVDEWTSLARAVAACQGGKTVDYLTERDLDDIAEYDAEAWDEAADGPLPARDEG